MEKQLQELHNNMATLLADAHDRFQQSVDREGLRQSLSSLLNKCENYNKASIFVNINGEHYEKIMERRNRGLKQEDDHFYTEKYEEKVEEMRVFKEQIEKACEKHGIQHLAEEFFMKNGNPTQYKYMEFSRKLNLLYKQKNENQINNSIVIQSDLQNFLTRYNDLIFDFNRSNGNGWYDYHGMYSTGNKTNYDTFMSEIKKLQDKGFDIIVLSELKDDDSSSRDISILTNSGNVRKIHDIIYQQCNTKKIHIDGQFITPILNQEFDISVLKQAPKNSEEFYNSLRNTNNKIPKYLESQFTSSVDAYGITKGIPQRAMLASLINMKGNPANIRHSIHIISENPLKAAKAIAEENKQIEKFTSTAPEAKQKMKSQKPY